MNDILVIRAPYLMKKEAIQKSYDQILKQMESGLVILPAGFSTVVCPSDIDVKFIDSNYDIVLGQDPFINKPCVSRHVFCHEDKAKVLNKIRAEIEEYKSRKLTLAIGVDDLEKGKQIALEYVLAILEKYKAESEE